MKLIVKKPFSWAHRGVQVEHFEEGAEIETEDPDLIDVSTREEWAAPTDGVDGPAAPPAAKRGSAKK